jgi:predicted enzyme related to lactoylglutathione lyase
MEMNAHPHGAFCFAERNTADMEREKRFYGELLGWEAFDVPSAQGGYSLFQVRGRDVAGLHLSPKGPQGWLSYVSVDNADRVAGRARDLGASVRTDPFDVPGIGRMAMLHDPAGGIVALWEARGHPGAGLVDEPGAICWNELVVHDVPTARTFYCDLLGWNAVETGVPVGSYTVLKLGERSMAGLMAIGQDWGPVTPHWQTYFAVEDCDGAVARTRTLGGSVVIGPMDAHGTGRFAVLKDAGDAVFAVFEARS